MAEVSTVASTKAPVAATPRRAWPFDRRLMAPLLIGWAGTLAAADLTQRGLRAPTPLLVVESLLYLALYTGLVSLAPVRAWLAAIPSAHRVVLGGIVVVATWGQLVVDSPKTFPFPAWTMYARPEARRLVEYYRYRGLDAEGREVWVDPANEFRFVNSAEIASHVKAIGRAATSPKDTPKRDEARGRFRDLLGAMASAYNGAHADAPLRSLEVIKYSWEFGKQPLDDVVPAPVLRVDIPEGAAR